MKCTMLTIIFLFVAVFASAQLKPVTKKETVINRQINPMKVSPKISYDPVVIKREIDSLLNKVLEKYTAMPNTAATWMIIKGEATDIMLRYFLSGQLFGTKPDEAFFVKMDAETMTAKDLLDHKMILVAGIAAYKPADFVALRVEKKNNTN